MVIYYVVVVSNNIKNFCAYRLTADDKYADFLYIQYKVQKSKADRYNITAA